MRISYWSSDVCSSDLRDDVDRFGTGQHPRRAGKVIGPDGAFAALQCGCERDRAFGHDARGWHRAREPPLAETVRGRVEERGEIRAAACQARETFALPCALVLDQRRDERHGLDPEARLDGLDLRREQFREMYGIARRRSSADADGLALPFDAVEKIGRAHV